MTRVMPTLRDYKTEKVVKLIQGYSRQKVNDLLVVGCGTGLEAAILAQQLGSRVVGIDVIDNFSPESAQYAHLQLGDAMALEFADSSFDFVYSYHTLEHIQDPFLALKEIRRVLREGGEFWIGTPNRRRLLAYIGSKTATIKQKIWWNLVDWRAKLTGRFRNELGAHAGFSSSELESMLRQFFPQVDNMTNSYYEEIYKDRLQLVKTIEKFYLSSLLFPALYFAGRK